MNLTVPARCPKCRGEDVARIVYGLIRGRLPAGTVGGGCLVSPASPEWSCRQCGHRWGRLQPRDEGQHDLVVRLSRLLARTIPAAAAVGATAVLVETGRRPALYLEIDGVRRQYEPVGDEGILVSHVEALCAASGRPQVELELANGGQTVSARVDFERGKTWKGCRIAIAEVTGLDRATPVEPLEPVASTPCGHCGAPLRTPAAQQCFECGADWH